MATSGFANWFYQHALKIAQSIETYIISSNMSVFVANVQRKNFEIMCILTSYTPDGITTYIERTAMATPRQPMLNSHHAMFTED
jgi:hypothetical protein